MASRGHARNQINLKGANSTDASVTSMFANRHVYADQDIADHFKPSEYSTCRSRVCLVAARDRIW